MKAEAEKEESEGEGERRSRQIIKRFWLIKKIRGFSLSIRRIDLSAVAYK